MGQFYIVSIIILFLGNSSHADMQLESPSQRQLECQMYDLATAQVLEDQSMPLSLTETSELNFEVIGVKGLVSDRPLGADQREHSVLMTNQLGDREFAKVIYSLSSLVSGAVQLPRVVVEIPGLGDMLQLSCAIKPEN